MRRSAAAAVGIGGTVAVILGGGASAGAALPAGLCGAAGTLSTSGATVTCTYAATGADAFSVPAGISSVFVTAVGGRGGNAGASSNGFTGVGGPGGLGAVTSADVTVAPSALLYVEVGGPGGAATNCFPGGAGGVNGGGSAGFARCGLAAGGGGGGASDVRTTPGSAGLGAVTDPRLLVAGGGGGGGGSYTYAAGGSGGNAGVGSAGAGSGADGGVCDDGRGDEAAPGLAGGDGGSGLGGGLGGGPACAPTSDFNGSRVGLAGARGVGGDTPETSSLGGGTASGGGGGGGYLGGGGGGALDFNSAGGGGGGSSFGPVGTSYRTATVGETPRVVVSYTAEKPSVTASLPGADGASFVRGASASTAFTCDEGAGGPGIASCVDQDGKPSGGRLDTVTVGPHALTITATSDNGLSATERIAYTVTAPVTTPTTPTTPTPTTPTMPAPSAVPAPTPTPAPAARAGSITLGKAAGAGRGRAVAVAATISGPGTIEAVATHTLPRAARSRAANTLVPGPGRLIYARLLPTRTPKTGKVALVLTRTAAGRRARFTARTITLRVVVKYTPTDGKAIRTTRNVRVRISG